MKLKPLALVVGILGLSAGLVYWRNSTTDERPSDPREGKPVVAVDAIKDLRTLRLVAGDQSVTLVTDKDGQQWTVPDYYGMPVDFDKLVSLVESLRKASIKRLVTARSDRLERLEFKGDLIELRGAESKPVATIHLGKNNESGGRFVKIGDEKKAYLADLDLWLDAVPKNWARSQLVDFKPDSIASVELRFADGSSMTAKHAADTGGWTAEGLPEGKEIKVSAIDSLLSQLSGLRFTDTTETTVADAVAAKAHSQSMVITLKDGTAYTLALGRRPAEKPAPEKSATADTNEQGAAATKGAITAVTPPVTVGADGKPVVVTLPPPVPAVSPTSGVETAAAATPAPEATPAPAGPVYAFISANREADPINALMAKRSFQVGEWVLNSLPANREALLQDKPAPSPAPPSTAPAVTAVPGSQPAEKK
jgi:hypothetical protein